MTNTPIFISDPGVNPSTDSRFNGSYTDFMFANGSPGNFMSHQRSADPGYPSFALAYYANNSALDMFNNPEWKFNLYFVRAGYNWLLGKLSVNGGNTDPTPNTLIHDLNVVHIANDSILKMESINTVFLQPATPTNLYSPICISTDSYNDAKSICSFWIGTTPTIYYKNIEEDNGTWTFKSYFNTGQFLISLTLSDNSSNCMPSAFSTDFPSAIQLQSFATNPFALSL